MAICLRRGEVPMGDLKGPLSNVQVVVVAARNSLFCVISTRRAREIVGHPWKCYVEEEAKLSSKNQELH